MLVTPLLLLLLGLPPGSEFPRHPDMNRFVSSTVTIEADNANRTYPYRLLIPSHDDSKLPLIVFLHGAGERGHDNKSQLVYLPQRVISEAHFRDKPCYLLALQCPTNEQWAPYDADDEPLGKPSPSIRAVMAAMQEVIEERNVDPSRIYLTGLSMGGYGSWDLAARHPEWFAAVVPVCGGGRPNTAPRLIDVPIWAFHGTDDHDVAEAESLAMIEAIRSAGGTPAYTALQGVGHDSWHYAYGPRGAIEWMFAQKNPHTTAFPGPGVGEATD